jgi:hypothetical protein
MKPTQRYGVSILLEEQVPGGFLDGIGIQDAVGLVLRLFLRDRDGIHQ